MGKEEIVNGNWEMQEGKSSTEYGDGKRKEGREGGRRKREGGTLTGRYDV